MQGNSVFSRSALRVALLTFGGSAPALAAPSAPTEDAARTILSRLVTLHEGAGLESFVHLDDALLDRIARTVLARGFSPMAQFTVNRANRPELFQGADRQNFDLALPRGKAADIAAYFLGRPALLQGEGDYVYGMAAAGPLLCEARLKGVANRLVKGAMYCEPGPGEPPCIGRIWRRGSFPKPGRLWAGWWRALP